MINHKYNNTKYNNTTDSDKEDSIMGGSIIIEDPISLSSSCHHKPFLSHLKSITKYLMVCTI